MDAFALGALILTTNDKVTTFTATANFVQVDVNFDFEVLLFRRFVVETGVEVFTGRLCTCRDHAHGFQNFRTGVGDHDGCAIQRRTCRVRVFVCVAHSEDRTEGRAELREVRVCLGCESDRILDVCQKLGIGVGVCTEVQFLQLVTECEGDLAERVVLERVATDGGFVEVHQFDGQQSAGLNRVVCQQVVFVEVHCQVSGVAIAVEVVSVIHRDGHVGGLAANSIIFVCQRVQVLDDQVAIGVHRTDGVDAIGVFTVEHCDRCRDFFVERERNGIGDVVDQVAEEEVNRREDVFQVDVEVDRCRATGRAACHVACFDLDDLDVVQLGLDVDGCCAGCRTNEFGCQLSVQGVCAAHAVKTVSGGQGVGNATCETVLSDVAQERVIVVRRVDAVEAGDIGGACEEDRVAFDRTRREEFCDLCLGCVHGRLCVGHRTDDCGGALSQFVGEFAAGHFCRCCPLETNFDLVEDCHLVVALGAADDRQDDLANREIVGAGDRALKHAAPECQAVDFTRIDLFLRQAVGAIGLTVEEVQVDLGDESICFFFGRVTQERVRLERFSLSREVICNAAQVELCVGDYVVPEGVAFRISCPVIITDVKSRHLLCSGQRV